MRRLLALLLCAAAVLCACGAREEPDAQPLAAAISDVNGRDALSGKYTLEMTFGQNSTLYYAAGDVEWDRAALTARASFTQNHLGSSVRCENVFENGVMKSIENGGELEVERDAGELFSKFPYFRLPEYSAQGEGLAAAENGTATTYTYTMPDGKAFAESVVGDLYSLVTAIKKPQREKTEYGKIACIIVVRGGTVESARYEYTVKLFDTPAYSKVYSAPESEYTVTVKVSAKITYK